MARYLVLFSHIDSMRVLQRTLIRAQISTKMSEGFNPHPITYTSHPLPLGVASEEEFFVVANEDMTTQHNFAFINIADQCFCICFFNGKINQIAIFNNADSCACCVGINNYIFHLGMEATHCFDCTKNPNFAKNMNYCEYFVSGQGKTSSSFHSLV
mgnify:CR=1 FL=1